MTNRLSIRVGGFSVHPIWYRHWLELRSRLLWAAVSGLICSVPYSTLVGSAIRWLHETGTLVEELKSARHLLTSMEPERLVVWGVHAHHVLFAWLCAAMVAQTAPHAFVRRKTALALPISIWAADLTGLAAQCSVVAAATLLTTALDAAILAVRGISIPGREMIATWVLLCALAVPVMAALAACSLNAAATFLSPLVVPLIGFSRGWSFLRDILFHPERAWPTAAIALTAAAIVFAASRPFARWRER